jgi:type I restriction enzyme S subunit
VNNWHRFRLGDIVITNTSLYSKKENWSFVKYLDTGNISENKIEQIQTIDLVNEKLPSRARRKVNKNDIVYSTVRPIQRHYGILKNVPKNFLVSTGFTTISATEKADPTFIYYYLTQNEVVEYLQTIAEQTVSTYPSIKSSDVENLQVYLPPLPTQRAIAATLSCLDDKIALNNRINANLEAQAQAIYDHFFGLCEQMGQLSNICRYSEKKITVANLSKQTYISTENMLPNKAGYKEAASLPKIAQTTKFDSGDVLISNIRPYFKKIVYCGFTGGCSADVLCFSAMNSGLSAFLYCTLHRDKFFDHMMAGSKGTKMPRGDKHQIMNYPVVIPDKGTLLRFSNSVNPILALKYSHSNENHVLAAVRDTLLPKLMSGELEVKR